MPIQDVAPIDQQQTPSTPPELQKERTNGVHSAVARKSAITTVVVLIFLWAGFHWDDPASWAVGVPTALIGGAFVLFLPASTALRLSPIGGLRFAKFAIVGILRGAVDVSRRSLSPDTLRPGLIPFRTYLPEGRPRQLFAVAITLLPGTLTARIADDMLTVHALNLSDETHSELADLEAHIAELYGLDRKEVLP